MHVLLRYEDAAVTRVVVTSAGCTLEARSPIVDLGALDTASSLDRLIAVVAGVGAGDRRNVVHHAMGAIAYHPDPRGVAFVARAAREDERPAVREAAWIWLARSGSPEAEAIIERAVRREQRSALREQAVFALSLLPDARAVPALVRVIEDRALARSDRRQAFFWLADAGSDEAMRYLAGILDAG